MHALCLDTVPPEDKVAILAVFVYSFSVLYHYPIILP
jgi:hypothetical protein